jgi:hypothetical protein
MISGLKWRGKQERAILCARLLFEILKRLELAERCEMLFLTGICDIYDTLWRIRSVMCNMCRNVLEEKWKIIPSLKD